MQHETLELSRSTNQHCSRCETESVRNGKSLFAEVGRGAALVPKNIFGSSVVFNKDDSVCREGMHRYDINYGGQVASSWLPPTTGLS